MKRYERLQDFRPLQSAVVTTGTFDGVHLGHQKILGRLSELAYQNKAETVLITFFPHPRLVLQQSADDFKLLNTLEEKADLLQQAGIAHFIVLPFTKTFSQMSPIAYATEVYQYIGTKSLVIGYDHRFGQARSGNIDFLRAHSEALGFAVEEIPRQDLEEVGISSTKIRQALLEGNVKLAHQYLGYPYSLSGKVQVGDQLGRTLDYPTANLQITAEYKLIPADGIYAIEVLLQGVVHRGVLYIGTRPTLAGKEELRIEGHIFDFEGNIYGQDITFRLIARIRGDMKFPDLASLKTQMNEDAQMARKILG